MTNLKASQVRLALTMAIFLFSMLFIRPNIALAQNIINIHSLGAYCDGTSHTLGGKYTSESDAQIDFPNIGLDTTDWTATQRFWQLDAAAINQAAYNAINQSTGSGAMTVGGSFLSSDEGLIIIGSSTMSTTANGTCLINITLNFTLASGRPIIFDARGATMICATGPAPCLDMTGAIGMDVTGLTIVGSATNTPTIGILMGRTSDAVGSNYNKFEHLTFDGAFTFADFVNVAGEDTTIYDGVFSNSASGSSGTTTQVFCYHCKTAWITGTHAVMTIRWAVTTSRFRDAGSSVWVVG